MTSYDAAAMVLAAAGSPFVKDSVETVRAFGSLETDRDVLTRLEANEGAPLARTLLAHLAYEFDVLNDDANRGRLRGPYTELFISPDDENYFGIGALDLLACAEDRSGSVIRTAFLRHFEREPSAEVTCEGFSNFKNGHVPADEQEFRCLASLPPLLQKRSVSPMALAYIALRL